MIEIAYSREKDKLKAMSQEVQDTIQGIVQILDAEYGADRKQYEDNGGYVIVVEVKADFEKIKEKTYIDCNEIIAEYVDKIVCSNGKVLTNSLIICNSDYTISLVIPMELTPQNLINYMTE